MITQTIQCDLLNNKPSENIIFRQGESGRVINFEILKDGTPVDLSAYDVAFSLYKPDGNFVIADCVVDDDTASVTETEQMTAVCGVGYFDLKISDSDEIIYTYNGMVLIDTPVITSEIINSLSEVFGLTFPDDFQEKLTAGDNITIDNNVISATGESVEITPIQTEGDKIAEIEVGSETYDLYSPSSYTPPNYVMNQEVNTGVKWINNKKIHRNMFHIGDGVEIATGAWYNTNIDINADTFVNAMGYNDGICTPLIAYKNSNGKLEIQTCRSGTSWISDICVEYTKGV